MIGCDSIFTTRASPEQVLRALTDFTESHLETWNRTLDPKTYELRESGQTWAVAQVCQGSARTEDQILIDRSRRSGSGSSAGSKRMQHRGARERKILGTGGAQEPGPPGRAAVNPERLPVLLLGQVASPECVCDEMPRPDRRGYGEANKDDKINTIDVLDAEPVE